MPLTVKADLIWPIGASLGEGPLWLPDDRALWFVDIKSDRLHCLMPDSGKRRSFDFPGMPSFIVAASDAGLIVGADHEIVRVVEGTRREVIATIDMPRSNRTNDATVDRRGRLWFGTMDNGETAPTGRVYRYDGALREMGGACTITNGPATSPDGRWLYHVDTLARTVWRFDIGGDADGLENGERFVGIAATEGNPDGVTVDAEGCLWVALWGGWGLHRYSPDGEFLQRVEVPCAQVTKVAFGGADLRTGYVTTARIGLSDGDLTGQPDAGGLFAFDAPAPGLPTVPLRLG
jgi:D-xylonolactonase